MKEHTFEIVIGNPPDRLDTGIYVFCRSPDGRLFTPKRSEFFLHETKEGDPIDPLFFIDRRAGVKFIQAFVDAAAQEKIFPSNYVPPKAELDAIRFHLEDMRKLVFKKGK
jgi:hypothetical protein